MWRMVGAVLTAAFTAFAMQSSTPALAQGSQVQVVLAWDYTASGAEGFAFYCGLSSRSYRTRNDVGDTLSATLSLIKGAVRFCAVTAYDVQRDESFFSNEVAISVTDAGTVIEELPLRVQDAGMTPTGFRVRFNRRIDHGALSLYSWQSGGGGPDVTLVGDTSGSVPGSLIVHPDNLGFTFVKSDGLLAPDSYVLTVHSRFDGLLDEFGRSIDGNGDGDFGDDYSLWPPPVLPTSSPVVGVGEFARGPGQPVDLPLSEEGAGIPVSIENGAGATDVEFRLQFDPRLLTPTDVVLAPGISGALTVKEIDQPAGRAHIRAQISSGLQDARTTLLSLRASVPPDAPYRAMHMLDISDVRVDGLTGVDDDGLHVVAFPGDASGNGAYTSLDLQHMRRVTSGLDTGFSAYPLADPSVVADVSGDGAISDLDESAVVELCLSTLAGSTFWNLTGAVKCSIVLP